MKIGREWEENYEDTFFLVDETAQIWGYPVGDVPAEVYEAWCSARDAFRDAEQALNDAIDANRVEPPPLPPQYETPVRVRPENPDVEVVVADGKRTVRYVGLD